MANPNIVPVPVQPTPVIPRRVPQGIAKMVQPENLSPAEKQMLMQLGWDGKSAVPINLAEQLATRGVDTRSAMALPATKSVALSSDEKIREQQLAEIQNSFQDVWPEGIRRPSAVGVADTIDTQIQSIPQLTEIPAPLMQRFEAAAAASTVFQPVAPTWREHLQDVLDESRKANEELRQNAGMTPQVADAVRQATAKMLEPAAPAEQAVDPVEPVVSPADLPKKELSHEELRKQKLKDMAKSLSKDDIENYTVAAITNTSFVKTYKLMNGAIVLLLREPAAGDYEMLMLQTCLDAEKNRMRGSAHALSSMNIRYELAMRLVSLSVINPTTRQLEQIVSVPTDKPISHYLNRLFKTPLTTRDEQSDVDPGDTPLRRWYAFLTKEKINGTLWNVLLRVNGQFGLMCAELATLSQEPDFFELTGQSN